MASTNYTSLTKFRRWLIASMGTIIVGLVGVWVQKSCGPAPQGFCAEYKVPNHVEGVLTDATTGKAKLVREIVTNSVLRGDYLLWVAECGESGKIYEHNLPQYPITVRPSSKYSSEEGKECRKLWVSQRIKGSWDGSEVVLCKKLGEWTLAHTLNSE